MKKKINRKGFSLPLSMVFLLVTVMLSMVLISAALSALTQVKKNKDNTQASLTVTDTATVLAKTIGGMEFQQNQDGTLSVLTDNGANAFAEYLKKEMKKAKDDSEGFSTSKLKMKENNTAEIEASVICYSMTSENYPGDIVISLKLEGNDEDKTTDYKTTFRMDGWMDEANQVIKFGEPIFYSGSEVYR